jgi:hypothetical protein
VSARERSGLDYVRTAIQEHGQHDNNLPVALAAAT